MKNSYFAWLAATSFVFFQFFLQSASTIMSEHWTVDFGLSEIELSNLSSAFFYSYIPMQLPAGILYDKFNAKIILFTSAVTLAVSSVVFSVVQNYELALIARFVMGLGAASGFVGLLKIIQDNFPVNRFALMFGIAEAIGMIGVALGLVLLATFLEAYTWRNAMLLCGIIAGILAAGIYFFVKSNRPQPSESNLIQDVRTVITNKQVLVCSLYGFFIVSILNCFTSLWGEPFLTTTYNFSPQTTSWLLSVVFIGLSIGSPLNGWFVKRYGRHKELLTLEAGLCMVITAIIILVPDVSLVNLFILFFLVGFFCSGYGPAYALVNEAVPSNIQATAVATANMLIVASAPVLQIITGAILESRSFGFAVGEVENYRIALTILPISYLISFLAGFFIKPSTVTGAKILMRTTT